MLKLLALFTVLFSLSALGQSKFSLSGSVVEGKSPVPYASVQAFSSADSSYVQGTVTDTAGVFSLKLTANNYYVKISFMQYEPKFISDINLVQDISLDSINLSLDQEQLDEFVVQGEKTTMELKLDKRVYNIGKDLGNQGGTASEVLENIPSIVVDAEGNVSLRGSGNVRILIDGKPAGLEGSGGADALRQITADMIESVEIITNPSARYDAEGEVGIINIILKKKRKDGFNGNLELTTGWPNDHRFSFNGNYRTGKLNFFAGVGAGYRRGPGNSYTYQKFIYPDTTYFYERDGKWFRGGPRGNANAGVTYDFNKKTSLTISGNSRLSRGDNEVRQTYTDFDSQEVPFNQFSRDEFEDDESYFHQVSANFRKQIGKPNHLFSAQFTYSQNGEEENAYIYEYTDLIENAYQTQHSYSRENENFYQGQWDYQKPWKKDGMLEFGMKGTYRNLSNRFYVEEKIGDEFIKYDDFNNDMRYDEGIYAAYVMAGNKFNKNSWQLGVRGEYSDIKTSFEFTDQVYDRDYFNLFPSAHFSRELDTGKFLQLSYSYRISRPRHWWLTPFFTFSDARNFMSGNPNLDPEFTHSSELGYLLQYDKGSFLTNVYHRYTMGNMTRVMISDSTGFTRNLPVNLGHSNSVGLELNGNYEITKGINLTGGINVFYLNSVGEYEGIDYSAEAFTFTTRWSAKWNVSKKWTLQSSFFYNAPENTGQGRRLPMYAWDFSSAWEILNGNGNLVFNVRDILNSRQWQNEIYAENFESQTRMQWRQRQMRLTFQYYINQNKRQRGRGGSGGGDFDAGM